jgi:hypothetical protein
MSHDVIPIDRTGEALKLTRSLRILKPLESEPMHVINKSTDKDQNVKLFLWYIVSASQDTLLVELTLGTIYTVLMQILLNACTYMCYPTYHFCGWPEITGHNRTYHVKKAMLVKVNDGQTRSCSANVKLWTVAS